MKSWASVWCAYQSRDRKLTRLLQERMWSQRWWIHSVSTSPPLPCPWWTSETQTHVRNSFIIYIPPHVIPNLYINITILIFGWTFMILFSTVSWMHQHAVHLEGICFHHQMLTFQQFRHYSHPSSSSFLNFCRASSSVL